MMFIKKEIFGGDFYVFEDTDKEKNKCGIVSREGSMILKPQFEDVLDMTPDGVIVMKRKTSPFCSDDIFFGLIDRNMNWIINPHEHKYCKYQGYLAVENKLSCLSQNNSKKLVKSIKNR